MSRRSNFNNTPAETHRVGNFERRLRQTMDSELESEHVTPDSAGAEELPEYLEVFPLVKQFKQTNMSGSPGRGRRGSDDQRQSKDRRPRSDEDDRS
jgi:hypothetical protein